MPRARIEGCSPTLEVVVGSPLGAFPSGCGGLDKGAKLNVSTKRKQQ